MENWMWSWSGIATHYGETLGWIQTFLTALSTVLWIALVLVGAAGAIYAIYVGVKMARAESSDQREEAKKRLINIIVSIVVTIVLILFFNTLLPAILSSLGVFDSFEGGSGESLAVMAKTAKALLRI